MVPSDASEKCRLLKVARAHDIQVTRKKAGAHLPTYSEEGHQAVPVRVLKHRTITEDQLRLVQEHQHSKFGRKRLIRDKCVILLEY